MTVYLGDNCYWECHDKGNKIKCLLRSKKTANTSMTINMTDYPNWLWDNLEKLNNTTDYQNRIIFCMENWGKKDYIIDRAGKIIFT